MWLWRFFKDFLLWKKAVLWRRRSNAVKMQQWPDKTRVPSPYRSPNEGRKKKKICGKMRSYLVQKWTFEKLNPGEDFQSAECRVDCFFVCDVAETSSTNRPPQSLWLHGSACAAGMRREGQPVQAVQHMTIAATVRRWREHGWGWGSTLIHTGGRRSEARGGGDKVVQKKKTTLAEHS